MDRVLSMIGLATKAGKVVSGEFSVEKSIKSGRAFLVVIAEEASENTRKKFTNSCEFYNVPLRFYGDKQSLGKANGKMTRTSISIQDEGFAKQIIAAISDVAE